ncbi:MAG: glycosyltransferase [Planctomycetaceae bacterium]|nr:glycosyltransferase [Planctomycetaceae bacterium]
MADLPKILLVSETTLATTKSGVAANPTLFNLFNRFSPERILSIAPESATIAHPPQSPFDRNYLDFKTEFVPRPRRGRRFVDPFFRLIDIQIREFLPIPHLDRITAFDPDVVVVSPITADVLVYGRQLAASLKKPFVVYFMDDWSALDRRCWFTGGIRRTVRQLLADSDAWMMISDELRDAMALRYGVPLRPTLVVHNPVDLATAPPPNFELRRSGTFRIVYTGSIQPMHADALFAVAEAVDRLRTAGEDIELVVHTAPYFEAKYRDAWSRWGVILGSLLPYDQLFRTLQQADLLLVALSFDERQAHMAMYSLLTKITDYMATGVPMLVCGPKDCASINFINRWNCGLTCDTPNVADIAEVIHLHLRRPPSDKQLAERAYNCLVERFSTEPVQARLQEFLRRVAGARK